MTIISCMMAITTAILLTSSCPRQIGEAGPAYCGTAEMFTLFPALLLGTGFLQCQQDWIIVLETDLIVPISLPPLPIWRLLRGMWLSE